MRYTFDAGIRYDWKVKFRFNLLLEWLTKQDDTQVRLTIFLIKWEVNKNKWNISLQ